MEWVEVGTAPGEVLEWRRRKLRRERTIVPLALAAPVGLAIGFAVARSFPNASSWTGLHPLAVTLELGALVASLLFAAGWAFYGWGTRNLELQVRRVVISDDRVHIQRVSGAELDLPLHGASVSKSPVPGGWYVIGVGQGWTSTFYAPPAVADAIARARKELAQPP
jgi:hypothetical protein